MKIAFRTFVLPAMDNSSYRSCIMMQLKERNIKEHSFTDLILHSNRLLESLDYLQKENINRKILSNKLDHDHTTATVHDPSYSKSDEINMLVKCCSLQKDLAECHKTISDYAQQVIEFKNLLDEKNKLLNAQKCELQNLQSALSNYQELSKSYGKELAELKTAYQNKTDECDTLNITYSSLESKKNDLEIENRVLKTQLALLRGSEPVPICKEKTPSTEISLSPKKNQRSTNESSESTNLHEVQESSSKSSSSELSTFCLDAVVPEKVKYEFIAHDTEVNSVCWMPSSHYLITAGSDRKVKMWEMSDNKMELRKYVRDCNSAIMSVDLDLENSLLLSASCDFASRVWTVSDFTIRHTLTGHSGKVMSAKFMREENQIISGSLDQTLKLWDLRRRVCVQTCSANSNVYDVISKGGHVVISGHADKKIRFWDTRSSSETSNILLTAGVTSLDLSRNGFLLLVCQQDSKLKLFDIRKYQEINSMSAEGFKVCCDWTRAKFSADNQYCSCGSKNGSVFIWNVPAGTVKKELKRHGSAVIACSWSSCDSYLATCDSKKRCIIWSNR